MLHVLVGAECNNNCVFCMESDRAGRRRNVQRQTPEDVRRFLRSYSSRDEILFTSGEPTLNPELPRYVSWAREEGFRTIGLISNGRRLSYRRYVAALLRAGLNKVTLSIHGHTAKLHDSLTRTPGSFAQSLAALGALSALKSRHRFDLHTSTVLVRRNVSLVREIHDFLSRHRVDRICFNVMMAKGRGEKTFDLLMPRYADVAASFRELAGALDHRALKRVSLCDIPRCTTTALPDALLGDQEHFDQFEPYGSCGIATMDDDSLGAAAGGGGTSALSAERLLARVASSDLSGDRDYYLTTRELKDDVLRLKRDECRRCRFEAQCQGVWQPYVDAHGWEEMHPVTGGPRAAASGGGTG